MKELVAGTRTSLTRGGSGPIGLCLAQIARAKGARLIICSDVYQLALDRAQELVADIVVLSDIDDVVRSDIDDVVRSDIKDVAAAVLGATDGRGADVVYDSTGNLAAQRLALSVLAPAGTCVLMAGAADGLKIGLRDLSGERVLTTAASFIPEELDEAIHLIESGKVRVKPMITHRFPLARVDEAFSVLRDKSAHGALKAIVMPQ